VSIRGEHGFVVVGYFCAKLEYMSTTEIEKIIHRLSPELVDELRKYLIDLVNRQEKSVQTRPPVGRLKAALKFKGDAPYPEITVSKAEYYEQYLS